MARVSEIAPGVQYQFSGEDGQNSITTTRVFRILKSSADEYVNLSQVCGVDVADQHPQEPGLYCLSYSAQYEGDSRMVILATFNYRTVSGTNVQVGSDYIVTRPEPRPANWSISSTLSEVPAYVWKTITGPNADKVSPCVNPAGDLYEGITKYEPIVTINVEQFETIDPTRMCEYVGRVNMNAFQFGSLAILRRFCMFRGVNATPGTIKWGTQVLRGFNTTYEFAYRTNWVGEPINAPIGWDIVVPQSGFNVKAWTPNLVQVDIDNFTQPLRRTSDGASILEPFALPQQVSVGQKMRAMIRVAAEDGKTIQRPSAQPIPLNDDGSGRSDTATPPVIVHRYQVYDEIDFSLFGLRVS